jgi:alkaline phosphatase D
VREHGVTGLAIVAGDKHSFWAGLASKELPPRAFDLVAVEFITGSVSSLGLFEAMPAIVNPENPLRGLYLADRRQVLCPPSTLRFCTGSARPLNYATREM